MKIQCEISEENTIIAHLNEGYIPGGDTGDKIIFKSDYYKPYNTELIDYIVGTAEVVE